MKPDSIINIAIADDQPLLRKAIKDLILSFGGYNIIAEAADGTDLIAQINKNAKTLPDICILDVSMKGMNGYETLDQLKTNWPTIKVLIYSVFYDDYIILEMMRKGANGYLSKGCSTMQFIQALATVYYTDYYYTEATAKKIFDLQQHKSPMLPKITSREMEFLRLCCSEMNYKEIGDIMGISGRTVEAFRNTLFTKFNLKTRTGLAIFALQNGIVPLSGNKGIN